MNTIFYINYHIFHLKMLWTPILLLFFSLFIIRVFLQLQRDDCQYYCKRKRLPFCRRFSPGCGLVDVIFIKYYSLVRLNNRAIQLERTFLMMYYPRIFELRNIKNIARVYFLIRILSFRQQTITIK